MNMISTGAFLPEMDASNKQETLAEKFARVWEKKNSKAARAGGVSLMALSLAACGSDTEGSVVVPEEEEADVTPPPAEPTVIPHTLSDDDDTGVSPDTISGTAGARDVISGVAGDLDVADLIVDTSSTDADELTVAIDADAVQYTIRGIETLNFSLDVLNGADATIDATNIGGATINASSSRVGFDGALDVAVLGTNNLNAGAGITDITVTDMGNGATIDVGSADTLTVDTTATVTSSANTIKLAGDLDLSLDFDTAAATDVVAVTLEASADAEVSIADGVLTFATPLTDSNQATIAAAGAGAITLVAADGDDVTGLTITGMAAVEIASSTGGTLDAKDIDSTINVTTGDTLDITSANGKTINAAKGDLDLTITAGDKTTDVATVNVSGLQDGGSITTVDLATANLNFAADVVEVLDLVLDGAAVVTVAGDIDFKDIDDTVAAASMTLSGSSDVTVTDSSLQTFTASDLTGALAYTQTGTDDLTLTSGAGDDVIAVTANGTAVITTGAGDDAVTALAILDGATDDLVVSLGAGDDTLTVDDTAAAGGLTVNGGDGTDTLAFADASGQADLTSVTLSLTSIEQIDVEGGGVTFLASQLTGQSYKFIGEGAGDLIIINGTAAADTADFSKLTFDGTIADALTDTTITMGAGNDTVTLSAAEDTVVLNDVTAAGIDTVIGFDADDDILSTGLALAADGDIIDATGDDYDTGNVDLVAAVTALAIAEGDATDAAEKAIVFNYGGDQYVLITDTTDGDAYDAALDVVVKLNGVDVDDLTAANFIA
jgi:hypothetical protein